MRRWKITGESVRHSCDDIREHTWRLPEKWREGDTQLGNPGKPIVWFHKQESSKGLGIQIHINSLTRETTKTGNKPALGRFGPATTGTPIQPEESQAHRLLPREGCVIPKGSMLGPTLIILYRCAYVWDTFYIIIIIAARKLSQGKLVI